MVLSILSKPPYQPGAKCTPIVYSDMQIVRPVLEDPQYADDELLVCQEIEVVLEITLPIAGMELEEEDEKRILGNQ